MCQLPEFGGECLTTAPVRTNVRQETRAIADLDRADDVFRWNGRADNLAIRQFEIGGAKAAENAWPPLLRQIALLGGKRPVPVIPCPGRLTFQISGRLALAKKAQHDLFIVGRGVSGGCAQPLGERLRCSQPSAFRPSRYHVRIERDVLWQPLMSALLWHTAQKRAQRRILEEPINAICVLIE